MERKIYSLKPWSSSRATTTLRPQTTRRRSAARQGLSGVFSFAMPPSSLFRVVKYTTMRPPSAIAKAGPLAGLARHRFLLLWVFLLHDLCWIEGASSPSARAQLILPSTCNPVAATSFGARLDLFYFYLLEFYDTKTGDNNNSNDFSSSSTVAEYLPRFDHAVASALVKHLSDCDGSDDRPLYGVLLSDHELSLGDGTCDPLTEDTVCQVFRGTTSVLLNGEVAFARNASLTLIEQVLSDTDFLVDYTGFSLLRSEFVRLIGENVVVLDDVGDDGEGSQQTQGGENQLKLRVYLGVTCGALVVVLLGITALYRNHRIAQKRRRFFHLEEDDNRWMTVDGTIVDNNVEACYECDARGSPERSGSGGQHSPRQRHAWSVSDLTSDSQSIMSSLHMDRIAEEGSSYQTDEEAPSGGVGGDDERPTDGHFDFIAHWKDPIEDEDLTDDEMGDRVDDEDDATQVRQSRLSKSDGMEFGDKTLQGHPLADGRRSGVDEDRSKRADAEPGAAALQPFTAEPSPASMSTSSSEDNDGRQLLESPASDGDGGAAWKGVRSTLPKLVPADPVLEKNSRLFRGDPFWRAKVFRPKQANDNAAANSGASSKHPSIPGPRPMSPLSPSSAAKSRSKENRQSPCTPVRYNLPIVESSWSEDVEVVLDEAGELLKSWASSALLTLSLSRHQKRLEA